MTQERLHAIMELPFGKQSGTSVNTPAHTSHFANKLIKSLLGQAAHIAKIYNPEIRDYYQRLISKERSLKWL